MNVPNKSPDGKDGHETNGKPPRPQTLSVRIDGIPEELRQCDQWVVWRLEFVERKWTKIPYTPATGRKASSTNRSTWSTFAKAVEAYRARSGRWDGIGIVFSPDDPYLGVDLDQALDETGALKDWAEPMVKWLDSYTEISPSGKGVKVWTKAKKPGKKCRVQRGDGQVEMYDTARFFTVTGHCWGEGPEQVRACQHEIDGLYENLFASHTLAHQPPKRSQDEPLSDDEIIEKARTAKNGDKFRRLFDHGDKSDYGNDDSRADQGLCNLLAFWARTPERLDGLFRRSALMRDKWNRPDYRERTISKAIESKTEFYEPGWGSQRNGTAPQRSRAEQKPKEEPSATPKPPSYSLGPLTIQTGPPRRTPTKIVVPLLVLRDGRVIDQLGLSTSMTGRRLVAQQFTQYLGTDKAREQLDAVLGQILADAAQAPAATAEGQTLRVIVAERVPEAMRFACRTKTGLWSEAVGDDVRRCDLVAFTPTWLMEAAGEAVDAPRDEQGGVNRPALLRAIQGELGVLWADLLTSLPREADVDLGRDTERGRQFRQAMIRLWKTPLTWEKQSTASGDTATRASLASRVLSQFARPRTGNRIAWESVHPACDAWWRPHDVGAGELHPLLALRWTLPGQVGIDLPGVRDEESLTRLGKKFGVIADPPEGVSSRLSGGKHRLAVLTLELCEELLETPNEDPEDNPREAGAEG